MTAIELRDHIVAALDDLKGQNILTIDVTHLTPITDYMVIVTGTSNRHVKALVDEVVQEAKSFGATVRGVEGRETYEWVLIDVGDVVVHVMQKEPREFYDLERLWSETPSSGQSSDSESTL